MKKVLSLLSLFFVFTSILFAQSPQGINYQLIARDGSGELLVNESLTFTVSISQGSPVYSEAHSTIQTNQYGLCQFIIGKGTPTNGTFSAIDWSQSSTISISANDGTTTYNFGNAPFQSVPYALYSQTANSVEGFDLTATPQTGDVLVYDNTSQTWKPQQPTSSGLSITQVDTTRWGNKFEAPTTVSKDDILVFDGTDWVAQAPNAVGVSNRIQNQSNQAFVEVDNTTGHIKYGGGTGENMIYSYDGNLGIGSSSVSQNRLAVTTDNTYTGYATFIQAGSQSEGLQILSNNTDATTDVLKASGVSTSGLVVKADGKIGIGVDDPQTSNHVEINTDQFATSLSIVNDYSKGGANNSTTGIYNEVTNGSSTSSCYGVNTQLNHITTNGRSFLYYGYYFGGGAGIKFGLYLQNEDINSLSGDLGLGTDAPDEKLDVRGNVRADTIKLGRGIYFPDGTYQNTASTGSGSPTWATQPNGITHAGGVHIGGVYGGALPLYVTDNTNGTTAFINQTGMGHGLKIQTTTNGNPLFITNDNNDALMTVQGNGNVGIGKTPTTKLDVDGIVKASELAVQGTSSYANFYMTSGTGLTFKNSVTDRGFSFKSGTNQLFEIKKEGSILVENEVNTVTTGDANMVPVAYGSFDISGGANFSGTNNVTVSGTGGVYTITDSKNGFDSKYTLVVSVMTTSAPLISTYRLDNNGNFIVTFYDLSNNPEVPAGFSFVIYKP